jgi:hypothetical protein
MGTTITHGKPGRLAVPKTVRDSLGLRFPVIPGNGPRGKDDIVKAIKAGRDERENRITPRRKKSQ